MVSALPGRTSGQESSLRCRQMVAAENEGQYFRLNVLYDWGANRVHDLRGGRGSDGLGHRQAGQEDHQRSRGCNDLYEHGLLLRFVMLCRFEINCYVTVPTLLLLAFDNL